MFGLRKKEDAQFERYFTLFQEKMLKRNCIFFLDHVEEKHDSFCNMQCADMQGWLMPKDYANEFNMLFIRDAEAQWDYDPFVYVDYKIHDGRLDFIIEQLIPVDTFYRLSKDYCNYITKSEITQEALPVIIRNLMSLYLAALSLPEMNCLDENAKESTYIHPEDIRIDKSINLSYLEVPDPYELENTVCGNIADDLLDIANDLTAGIKEYDCGKIADAVFEWKLRFEGHWGYHVVDALRALHSLTTGSH